MVVVCFVWLELRNLEVAAWLQRVVAIFWGLTPVLSWVFGPATPKGVAAQIKNRSSRIIPLTPISQEELGDQIPKVL